MRTFFLLIIVVLAIGEAIDYWSHRKKDDCELHTYLLKNDQGRIMAYVQVFQHYNVYAANEAALSPYHWTVWIGSMPIDSLMKGQLILQTDTSK